METKTCLRCDKEIEGRSDKKFCSDQCRNIYNNQINRDASMLIKRTDNAIKRNRKILMPLAGSKTTEFELSDSGFNFHLHTSIAKTKNGGEYVYCYEYGYMRLGEGVVLVVRKNNI